MADVFYPKEILHFPNNMPIEITYKNTQKYKKCRSYDARVTSQAKVWHQIRIVHKGLIRGPDESLDALDAIFEVIDGEEMYPVAYRHGERDDCFLVRSCPAALDKLFAQKLRVQLSNARHINLVIECNVAEFKIGQISPTTKIAQALNSLYDCMEHGILNLTDFKSHKEFTDVVVNLNNRSVFVYVCTSIYRNDNKFRTLNGIMLNNNRLTTLAPLIVFEDTQFAVLDLRNNELTSPTNLCRDLKDIKAGKLFLAGNPITKTAYYPGCLKPILKNFKYVDGVLAENLNKDYTPMSSEVNLETDGYRIDWSNKEDINNFAKSEHWHAILIPDADEEFTKDQIFDYFFINVSQEKSEFFPCYYKYFNNEHRFLVRQCFDQLKHLVENCNLEVKIPRLTTPPSSPREEGEIDVISELTARVMIDKSVSYYMRLNISAFKSGQIEPMAVIQKALEQRFSPMDRVLNLDKFQSAEGLENIVINLGSTKILGRILTQVSRKFLATCVELRLAENKIMRMDIPKSLFMMTNLKAIDLANNWIHDLESIKDLKALRLKSLRLDGNPVCSRYSFAGEYIRAVRRYFPDLNRLDDVAIQAKGNLCSQKNFLCDVDGYDFVQTFVPNYYQLYESDDRMVLKDFYHERAVFTMTYNFKRTIATASVQRRVSKYAEISRNLKDNPRSKLIATTFVGTDEILSALTSLPKVSHDIVSFSTDTITFNENMITITIHGLFNDQKTLESDIKMAFSRTFVLMPVERNLGILECGTRYKIINDQFNIVAPTDTQIKHAFKLFKNEDATTTHDITVEDRKALLVMFKCVTSLSTVWCSRCLEEADWDFQKALEQFTMLCERKEIPDTAFV